MRYYHYPKPQHELFHFHPLLSTPCPWDKPSLKLAVNNTKPEMGTPPVNHSYVWSYLVDRHEGHRYLLFI